ncbi:MAG: hypothetical protein HW389_759 [Bacteroidetes bacterium]|nr:hypothetical protein [Bacteroidota bacterium]
MPVQLQTHDPQREVNGLREKLGSDSRRLGFFIGSGTSMAVGLPGIVKLTTKVAAELDDAFKTQYNDIISMCTQPATVEDALNKIRTIRELLTGNTKQFAGLNSLSAQELDSKVCDAISKILSVPPPNGLKPHLVLARWIRHIRRDSPVELFTTNYDLLLERALEEVNVPFFDGFVGAVDPFFVQESVEADLSEKTRDMLPPRGWTRLWKVHGSIGWRIKNVGGIKRIVRTSDMSGTNELIIHPSKDKYLDSRKLPFMTYLDRLRNFLNTGECLLVIVGYSFRDEHLNATIFDALRSNNRLAVIVLSFAEPDAHVLSCSQELHNLCLLGPKTACIGGVHYPWAAPTQQPSSFDQTLYWDSTKKEFTLGDFNHFAAFLDKTVNPGQVITTTIAAATATAPAALP